MAKVDKPIRPFAIDCGGPSATIASHSEGNSVREIASRFLQTGLLPQSLVVPQYFDTTKVPSLLEALNVGAKFNDFFSNLPAEVRDEFRNDPKVLMKALNEPKDYAKLVKLGLLKEPPKVPAPLGSKENPFHTVVPEAAPPPDKGAAK